MADGHGLGLRMGIAALLLAAGAAAHAQDAASLVRQVREREAWIDHVESLLLKAEGRLERTPQGIEQHRKALQKQFPGADLSDWPDLQMSQSDVVELAFDHKRVRLRATMTGESDDFRIWDGKRFILHNHYEKAPDRDGYLIHRDPEPWLYRLVWTRFFSFRAGPHLFWWHGPTDREQIVRLGGKPEDFVYGGQAKFHGSLCHVVSHRDSWTTLYIAVEDGRLCGIRSGALRTRKRELWFLDQLRNKGYQFRDLKELESQPQAVTKQDRDAIARQEARELPMVVDPAQEFWLSDENEVAPGCLLPLTQGMINYEVGEDGKPFVSGRYSLKITEAKIHERLPDALFAAEFKEGEWISDQTHEPPLRYRHQAIMTPEEWDTILAEGNKRAQRDRDREQKHAGLIGRAATQFPAGATWLNSKPLDRSDLAGKVILLDFWAESCGPCRNDLPVLSALHKRLPGDVVIIGVHPPGSDPDAIRKVVRDFDMNYPICIDIPAPRGATALGRLYDFYQVDRIPNTLVIDRQGKIAATGTLQEMLTKASEVAGKPL
jgi:thiol-disulfide isomerase/thioredoxin